MLFTVSLVGLVETMLGLWDGAKQTGVGHTLLSKSGGMVIGGLPGIFGSGGISVFWVMAAMGSAFTAG
ncbi:hypothetical protein DKY63_30600 [Pseudomonas putida]|uniref:Uncharacterized protein n=1 Tax=Pseudomonas putida TaxID=303 RepID=A0A2Z4RUM0_PSEPU|nr:hypothetical protein DKY63_30600 [Pseudomonas putida]